MSPPRQAPTLSATLILLRKQHAAIAVYLLRRSATNPYLPRTYVFPGGIVDADDRNTGFWRRHVDHGPEGASDRLPPAVAAIRETFEETGLLLAAPTDEGPDTGQEKQDPIDGFAHRIESRGLQLSLSRLIFWRRWITPEVLPKRFDTYYFMAAIGPDEACRPDGVETDLGVWLTPETALRENRAGRLPLSPPTFVTLHQLLAETDIDRLFARSQSRPRPEPIMPRWLPLDKGALIVEPWDPEYARSAITIHAESLEKAILPVGAPFSRLWVHRGQCRPVA